MKTFLIFMLGLGLYGSALSIDDFGASSTLTNETEILAENELVGMLDRGWTHLGCVSQVNASSTCRSKASARGYGQSRIQQDYICPPKVLYSCYGK